MVRQRHPLGANSRETHRLSSVDFAAPSNRLYGSEMDIEAVSVLDLGQGSVTEGAIVGGGLDGAAVIKPGTLPPSAGDQDPPALPTMITVTSELVTGSDGQMFPGIKVNFLPPPDADYSSTTVEATDVNDNDPVTPSPVWNRPLTVVAGVGVSTVYFTTVAGNTLYWVRLRSVDTQGNVTAYSGVYPVTTVADTVPPPIPQNVTGAGGFKAFGVRWAAGTAFDLMFNEVRFALDTGSGPDTANWNIRRTVGNFVYIDGLLGGTSYYAQVRAVDYSRNVVARWAVTGVASTDILTCPFHAWTNGQRVSMDEMVGGAELEAVETLYVRDVVGNTFKLTATVGGAAINFTTNVTGFVSAVPAVTGSPDPAVNYLNEPEAGWSSMVGPFTAAMVGTADMALNSAMIDMLNAGIIDADLIQTGHLTISTGTGSADGIIVKYGGAAPATWSSASGTRAASSCAARPTSGPNWTTSASMTPSVTLYKDGLPQIAMTPDGLNASAINFGVHQGGHNLVFNSSFELSKFLQTVTDTVGSGGDTMLGGAGGWVLVSNTGGVLAAASITFAP